MLGVQAKLTVSAPDDRLEQEADRVADDVMRMPEQGLQRQAGPKDDDEDESAQLKTPESSDAIQRQPVEEEEEIQAKALPNRAPAVTQAVAARIGGMRGSGKPLPDSVRAFYEPRFRADFNRTRIHTGALAVDTARALRARAFTLGKDIYFDSGEYQPATARGGRLLAHELTHVVQQTGKGAAIGQENREGARNGSVISPAVQRKPKAGPTEEEETTQKKRPTGFLGWWLRKRVPKGLKPTKRRAQRANTLLDLADAGDIELEAIEKAQLQKLAGAASTKEQSTGKKSTAAGASRGAKSTDTDLPDAEPESAGAKKAVKVPALIKGAPVDNPDALEWRHFKPTDKQPKIGKKKVVAATDVTPEFTQGRFIANFRKTSAVWSHIEPFDKQAHWIDPSCKPILTRCNTVVDKLGKDLSLVKQFPSGFSWNADIICTNAESGTAEQEVRSRSDCEALFTQCSAANPIAHKDQLLCHERGHLWINALASERANEHLAAGKPQPKVAAELGKMISGITASYELETDHGCPTLGTTRCWDGDAVRKQVEAVWPKPESPK